MPVTRELRPFAEAGRAIASWELAPIAIVTCALSVLVHTASEHAQIDVATPVFGISATLVALVIPAAALAGQTVETIRNHWAAQVTKMDRETRERAKQKLRALVEQGRARWRALTYTVLSLPLATISVFRISGSVLGVPMWQASAAAAVAFLLAGVAYFIPVSWQLLQVELTKQTLDWIDSLPAEHLAAPGHDESQADNGGESQRVSYLAGATQGLATALWADIGCVIGAIVFLVLIIGSAVFASQLTPCTSASGIPCGH